MDFPGNSSGSSDLFNYDRFAIQNQDLLAYFEIPQPPTTTPVHITSSDCAALIGKLKNHESITDHYFAQVANLSFQLMDNNTDRLLFVEEFWSRLRNCPRELLSDQLRQVAVEDESQKELKSFIFLKPPFFGITKSPKHDKPFSLRLFCPHVFEHGRFYAAEGMLRISLLCYFDSKRPDPTSNEFITLEQFWQKVEENQLSEELLKALFSQPLIQKVIHELEKPDALKSLFSHPDFISYQLRCMRIVENLKAWSSTYAPKQTDPKIIASKKKVPNPLPLIQPNSTIISPNLTNNNSLLFNKLNSGQPISLQYFAHAANVAFHLKDDSVIKLLTLQDFWKILHDCPDESLSKLLKELKENSKRKETNSFVFLKPPFFSVYKINDETYREIGLCSDAPYTNSCPWIMFASLMRYFNSSTFIISESDEFMNLEQFWQKIEQNQLNQEFLKALFSQSLISRLIGFLEFGAPKDIVRIHSELFQNRLMMIVRKLKELSNIHNPQNVPRYHLLPPRTATFYSNITVCNEP